MEEKAITGEYSTFSQVMATFFFNLESLNLRLRSEAGFSTWFSKTCMQSDSEMWALRMEEKQ